MAQIEANDVVEQAIDCHAQRPGGLLPLLHEIQDGLGYLPETALARIAVALHQSLAEIFGVVRFYHHFRLSPPGRHVVRLCLAEACQSMGANQLLAHARKTLRIDLHQTTG
jgi:formate dehydrogenase subunit gamma